MLPLERKTLVLNQGYEPIRVITWQRAVTLVWLDKATVLTEYEDSLRSKYLIWNVPAVIWLRKKSPRFTQEVKLSRHYVYARDQWTCQYCGEQLLAAQLTFDHVIPRTRGGRTTWTNIVAACSVCNQRKGGRTPEEAGMHLLRKPKKPKWLPELLVKSFSHRSVPEQWHDFIGWLAPAVAVA